MGEWLPSKKTQFGNQNKKVSLERHAYKMEQGSQRAASRMKGAAVPKKAIPLKIEGKQASF